MRTMNIHNFKEYEIPIGVIEQPYVEMAVLVYHNTTGVFGSIYFGILLFVPMFFSLYQCSFIVLKFTFGNYEKKVIFKI